MRTELAKREKQKVLIFFSHFLFLETELFKQKHKGKNVSDTFPYKEAKFSKHFLIIIKKRFFSFYNIFFYTQQAFAFHLLSDFRNVHDHIDAFFFLFFINISIAFTSFFCSLYFPDNI